MLDRDHTNLFLTDGALSARFRKKDEMVDIYEGNHVMASLMYRDVKIMMKHVLLEEINS